MQVGHVVAAVEVVVDEHFPVAVEDVVTPVEPVQAAEVEAAYLRHQVGAEVLLDRRAFGCDAHEHPVLPGARRHRDEAVRRRIEVAHVLEGRRCLERALERVGPAVIRAGEPLHAARGLGHDRRGVVPADVEESAQHAVAATHDQQRLAGQFKRDVLARLPHLVQPAGVLPGARERRLQFEFEDARVHVPGGRRRAGFLERQPRVVAVDQCRLAESSWRCHSNDKGPGRCQPGPRRWSASGQNSWRKIRPKVRGWLVPV